MPLADGDVNKLGELVTKRDKRASSDPLREALQRLINVCRQPDIYPHVRGHVALAEAVLAHPAPDPPSGEAALTLEQVRTLIAEWRRRQMEGYVAEYWLATKAFACCADELEALLAAPETEKR